MKAILGIDPGLSTGFALYHDGKLQVLTTVRPHELADVINDFGGTQGIARIIFEDSRLTSHVFTTVKSRPAALKMARNIGQIDAWSGLINSVCEKLKIPCHGISPKQKGKKLNAEEFLRVTGWEYQSNQHERDAAMCAWPYRGAL